MASLNATGIENMMKSVVPLAAYYAFQNQTFDINYEDKALLYKIEVDTIHFNKVSGFKDLRFEFVEGTDKLNVRIGQFDISMDIDGEFDALYFIPLEATQVNITNATIDFVLETTTEDQVHWTLTDTSNITFDTISIGMKNKFLDELVAMSSKAINALIKSELPKITAAIDAEITKISDSVATEGPYTFAVPFDNEMLDLNLTMTKALEMNETTGLINFHFDGLWDLP